VKHRPVLY